MNLLDVRLIRRPLESQWFLLATQSVLLVAFGWIIVGGIGVDTTDMAFAKVLRNTNLANLAVWAYWWPLVIVTAVLFGRVWCMVCPMELVNSLTARFGLRMPVPSFLQRKWGTVILYGVILYIGVHVFSIHRVPHRMALYMLGLLGATITAGLLYEKRAFCNAVCPVGSLVGLYACMSPFKWGATDFSVCGRCGSKDCVSKDRQYRLVGRSCTSNLFPPSIRDNRDCLLCAQCLKVCPNDNVSLAVRKPFADFFGRLDLRAAEVGFVLLAGSFVVYDILPEWPVTEKLLYGIPRTVGDAFGIRGILTNVLSGGFLFVIFPALFLLAVVGLTRIISGGKSGEIAGGFALLLLPSVGCAHAVKSLFKMSSRLPYFPYAFSDPAGVVTANKIVGHEIVPSPFLPALIDPVLNYMAMIALGAVLVVTFMILSRSEALIRFSAAAKTCLFAGVFSYWAIVTLAIVMWRF